MVDLSRDDLTLRDDLTVYERIGAAKAIIGWFIKGAEEMDKEGEHVNHDLRTAYNVGKKWMDES